MSSDIHGQMAGRRRFEFDDEASERERAADRESRSIVDLIKELRDESMTLVRQEVELAKAEMSEKASQASRNLVLLVLGGIVCGIAAIFLAAAVNVLIYLGLVYWADLPHAYAGWIAPLVTALVAGAIGAAYILKGKQGLADAMGPPERTIESLKRDRDLITEKVHS